MSKCDVMVLVKHFSISCNNKYLKFDSYNQRKKVVVTCEICLEIDVFIVQNSPKKWTWMCLKAKTNTFENLLKIVWNNQNFCQLYNYKCKQKLK